MTTDGYPFFAGKIKMRAVISLNDTDVRLIFPGKIHYGKVFVNGNRVNDVLFTDDINISEYAVAGDNVIEIEIYTGLRNFYGPHHSAIFDEIGGVSPNSFIYANTWKNDGSIYERKSYSLVRTGIFNPEQKEWYQ